MTTERFSEQVLRELCQHIPTVDLQLIPSLRHNDEDVLYVPPQRIAEVATLLKPHFPFLMDICGVDYLEREQKFEVVYHFADPEKRNRLRVKVRIDEKESVPTLTTVYKGADWFEREAFDLFGIVFEGHHNLRRILCHEDFVGHPLRKDYPADRRQSLSTPLEHSFQKDRARMLAEESDHLSDKIWLNIGPSHPATHGTLRFMAILEGETIHKVDIEIGYLHRCFEKMAETHNYNQIIPYTDRLNYCSAPLNNNAWCRAVEKMCGITIPDRAKVVRIILDEFSRIIDHAVCIGTQLVDLGALTNFWLFFRAREAVYDLFEKLCGARLTVSLARVGGLGFDIPDKAWLEQASKTCDLILDVHKEIDELVTKNRIFVSRMVGITPISIKDAIDWGFTGPCLRACGSPRDLRKDEPYGGYENFDFDIPIGETGDCYDRYMVRMEEIVQSVRIIRQALDNLPSGPIIVNNRDIALPGKDDVYGNIEGLMHQFMKVIYDVQPPVGEIYSASEGANGELGFYIVSDGSSKPYRVKCRPPCFAIFQSFTKLLEGHMVADAVAALGTINIVAGELDR
jgi:NADH-quinone oxidoreductase subunit C/D